MIKINCSSTIKKLAYRVVCFMALSIVYFSCGQEESINQDVALMTDTEIQDIALKHNDALAYVLEGLKNKKATMDLNEENFSDVVNIELHNYYKTIYVSQNDLLSTADNFSQHGVSKYLKYSNSGALLKLNTELTPIESTVDEFGDYLSANQISLLLQCDQALKSAENNIAGTIMELDRIHKSAKENLTAEEAQVILIGVEIGKASLKYWDENFDQWQEVISPANSDQARTQGWFSGSELVGADVAGGVGAAVTTVIVNAAPGAGQIAYGTAILAGAAGTSAADAVIQVWNHFF